jgi:hypothetical protein
MGISTNFLTHSHCFQSRLFKSGDMGQVLIVYDPDDVEETSFFLQQRHDPYSHTLLSGLTPPSTFVWSRIFKKQNRPPKVDFAKVMRGSNTKTLVFSNGARNANCFQVEQDLGEVNVAGKEDVETDFIHPKELDKLFLKPGQRLRVDGIDIEPIPGLSVEKIIQQKRQETQERLIRQMQEEKRRKKLEKRRRKEGKEGIVDESAESVAKRGKLDAGGGGGSSSVLPATTATTAPPEMIPAWQKAAAASALEAEIVALQSELASPGLIESRQTELRQMIEEKKRALMAAMTQ